MQPKNRVPTHPGEILLEEFLKPAEITQKAFAAHIGVTTAALSELIKGKRSITVNTAQRLAMALNTSPEVWLNLQQNYDLATAPKIEKNIKVIDLLAKGAGKPRTKSKTTARAQSQRREDKKAKA